MENDTIRIITEEFKTKLYKIFSKVFKKTIHRDINNFTQTFRNALEDIAKRDTPYIYVYHMNFSNEYMRTLAKKSELNREPYYKFKDAIDTEQIIFTLNDRRVTIYFTLTRTTYFDFTNDTTLNAHIKYQKN